VPPARLVDGKPPRERRWGGPWVHALSVVLNGHAFEMLMRTSLGEASGWVVWTLLLVNLVALAVNVAFLLTHFDNMLRALLKRTTAATAATTTAVTSAAPPGSLPVEQQPALVPVRQQPGPVPVPARQVQRDDQTESAALLALYGPHPRLGVAWHGVAMVLNFFGHEVFLYRLTSGQEQVQVQVQGQGQVEMTVQESSEDSRLPEWIALYINVVALLFNAVAVVAYFNRMLRLLLKRLDARDAGAQTEQQHQRAAAHMV
jgi:hypothetical protein